MKEPPARAHDGHDQESDSQGLATAAWDGPTAEVAVAEAVAGLAGWLSARHASMTDLLEIQLSLDAPEHVVG